MLNFIHDIKNRGFIRLWWAQLISQFGDRLHQMALIKLVADRAPGSTMGLAKLLAFTIIPVFIVGPIAGVYVDRWDRKKTLFICDILRGLLVLTIPLYFIYKDSMVPIYIIVFLAFCCSRFYIPAKMSYIPDLVSKENLITANSLITTTGMIAFVLGAALGGFAVEMLGARWGFIWDASTFFISGLLVISISRQIQVNLSKEEMLNRGREFIAIEKNIFSEMKEGIKYLISLKEIRFVINMLFTLLSAAGAVYVVIIVFIQQTFHSETKHIGVLAVCLGAGLLLGTLAYGKWGKNFRWYNVIFSCLIFGGLMLILFASVVSGNPNIWIASGLAMILGLVIGPVFIASNTVVHMVSSDQMRGKVFSALEIVIHFAFLVAMLISSFLVEKLNVAPVWVLGSVGLLFAVIGLSGMIRYRKGDDLVLEGEDMA
ncbi:MAG: MFS transporter [Candidatus Omnitrophica bacterium]|nr:MFS transporter [Candidatus Omnitrophota bacterium]